MFRLYVNSNSHNIIVLLIFKNIFEFFFKKKTAIYAFVFSEQNRVVTKINSACILYSFVHFFQFELPELRSRLKIVSGL